MAGVLESLGREHVVFRRLVKRLRDAGADETGRKAIVQTLLVLLPALQGHDQIEDLVFGHIDEAWPKDEVLAHRLVDAQHAAIRALRAECEAILASEADASIQRLQRLGQILAEKLSWHFETEEMLLWPLYARRGSRSLDASLMRRAEHGLQQLKYAVAKLEEGVEQKA